MAMRLVSRALPVLVLLLFLAPSASAQDTGDRVTTTQKTDVYRVPSTDSEVQTSLEQGVTVEVHSAREGWLAIGTPDGMVGWIEARFAQLASLPAATPPPPQPAATGTTFTPPPPPPARPPTGGGGATNADRTETNAATPGGGGFYGRKRWARISVGLYEGGPGGALAWGTMLARRFEWRMNVSGWKRNDGNVPGANLISGAPSGLTAPIVSSDPLYSMSIGVGLNFFVLQPSEEIPFGIHLGAVGAWNQFFATERPDVGDYNTYFFGGEGGVYYRGPKTLVRASLQMGPRTASFDGQTASETVTNFTVGLEPQLGGMRIGAFFHRFQGDSIIEIGFTFPHGN